MKGAFMRKFSKKAATSIVENQTELQFDGSSGYACGGGADF